MEKSNFSLIPLYRWEFKIAGLITFLAALCFHFFIGSHVKEYAKPLIVLSYLLIIFSKEKFENEYTQKLRYTAFKGCLQVLFAVAFSVIMVNIVFEKQISFDPLFISTIIMFCFLMIYYPLLIFRFDMAAEDLGSSITKYKGFYLVYVIILMLLSVIALFA